MTSINDWREVVAQQRYQLFSFFKRQLNCSDCAAEDLASRTVLAALRQGIPEGVDVKKRLLSLAIYNCLNHSRETRGVTRSRLPRVQLISIESLAHTNKDGEPCHFEDVFPDTTADRGEELRDQLLERIQEMPELTNRTKKILGLRLLEAGFKEIGATVGISSSLACREWNRNVELLRPILTELLGS